MQIMFWLHKEEKPQLHQKPMPTFLLAAAWPNLATQGIANSEQETMCLSDFSG